MTELETPDQVEAKPAKTPRTLSPCLCRAYAVERKTDSGDVERVVTGCETETTAKFAPGHDAKLKSLLISAGAEDLTVIKTTDEGEVPMTAMGAAGEFGFVSTVEKGIVKAQERNATKAARLEAREAKKAEQAAIKAQRQADREAAKAARDAAKAAKAAEAVDSEDVDVLV